MKRLLIFAAIMTTFYFQTASTMNYLHFSELIENDTYYVKSSTLFEDKKGVLWCQDSFSPQYEDIRYEHAHRVPVKKINGKLSYTEMHHYVRVKHDTIHDKDISNLKMIEFTNTLPKENRSYTIKTLPEGEKGFMYPWGLVKIGEEKYVVKCDARVDTVYCYDHRDISVKKLNGKILIDKKSFDEHKDKNKLDIIKQIDYQDTQNYNFSHSHRDKTTEELVCYDDFIIFDAEIVENLDDY